MATYAELYDLALDSSLLNKTAVAITDIANDIQAEANTVSNHTNRLLWAKGVFNTPALYAPGMLRVALVKNIGLTNTQIKAVSDANLKTALAGVVDLFATGS